MPPAKLFEETTLSVNAIKDFQICALLHNYRHREQLPEPIYSRELLAQRFENTMRRVLNFFFYKKQAGIAPSYNALLNRWEKLWFPKDMTAYDMAVEQHDSWHGNLASYTNDAALSLLKFHEDFYEDDAMPILIEEGFVVPVTKTLRLEGNLDLVLLYKDQHHKVIKFSTRQKRPTRSTLMLDFAAQKYAFDYRNSKGKSAAFYLYDAGSSRPGFVRVHPTTKDVDALIYWAMEAAGTENFVPRRGLTTACKGCPFDEPCSRFVITHDMVTDQTRRFVDDD